VQAFRRGRSGDGLESEKVSDCICGRWKFEIRSVHDFAGERFAARDLDGLSTVVGLLTTGVASRAGLSAAQIFGARQFVAGVIDDFVGLKAGWCIGAEAGYFAGDDQNNQGQKRLEQ